MTLQHDSKGAYNGIKKILNVIDKNLTKNFRNT